MKRSDFLQELYNVLEVVQFSPANQHKNYVDIVIQEAERLGMMPTRIVAVNYDDLNLFERVEGWEPES